MAPKSITFLTVLVVILVATQAEAQGIIPLTPNIPLANIIGNVSCSVNDTGPTPFPNALVQLRCLEDVIGSAITDAAGGFGIFVSGSNANLNILSSPTCSVYVVTPLANCNATLPSTGVLRGPIQFLGTNLVDQLGDASIMIADAYFKL